MSYVNPFVLLWPLSFPPAPPVPPLPFGVPGPALPPFPPLSNSSASPPLPLSPPTAVTLSPPAPPAVGRPRRGAHAAAISELDCRFQILH
jgi:hypothetical protein